MLDGNLMERTPEFIARTEAMANANLGVWQTSLASDFGPDGKVRYLPFLGCHLGMQGGWPVR